MKTILILVGKTVNKHFVAGINDYAGRISHYLPFEIVTIPELRNAKNLSEEQQKSAEGELILNSKLFFFSLLISLDSTFVILSLDVYFGIVDNKCVKKILLFSL